MAHFIRNTKSTHDRRSLVSTSSAILLAAAGVLLPGSSAQAILSSYADQVDECVWSPVVSIRASLPGGVVAFCSGVHMRNGLIVTAAHCLDGAQSLRFRFGENGNAPEMAVDLDSEQMAERCHMYPGGHAISSPLGGEGWQGPDIGFCTLPTHPGGLPESTPLLYGSCEMDYFHKQLSGGTDLDAVGMGSSIVSPSMETHFGVKRAVQTHATGYIDTQGAKYLRALQPDPCAQSAIVRGGDSGSPLFEQMEDQSFRVVGIAAAIDDEYNQPTCDGATRTVLYTPLALYVPWIEHTAARDLTRCHEWNQDHQAYEWDTTGFCAFQSYTTTPYETGDKSWDDLACFDVHDNITPYFSGECAGWDPCPLASCLAAPELGEGGSGGFEKPSFDLASPRRPTHGISTGGSTKVTRRVVPTLLNDAKITPRRTSTTTLRTR